MHVGDTLPLADPDAPMGDVIYIMSSKGFGAVGVTEKGKLIGFISDGDLRRHMAPDLLQKKARDICHYILFHCRPNVWWKRLWHYWQNARSPAPLWLIMTV